MKLDMGPSAALTPRPEAIPAPSTAPKLIAEFVGSGFLLAGVVGSGIMAERLAAGNAAVALLANAIATGGVLFVLILVAAPISGAHFNPVVTMMAVIEGDFPKRAALPYLIAQCAGAALGVLVAHAMFSLPLLQTSSHVRTGVGQWIGEIVATAGLLATIRGCRRQSLPVTAVAIAAYIVAAYWFTSSTSFANPAVTIARSLTDTFAGIRPTDVPGFVIAQMGALLLVAASIRLTDRGTRATIRHLAVAARSALRNLARVLT